MMKTRLLPLVAFVSLSGSALLAGNWPSFRGESASGVGVTSTSSAPARWLKWMA